MVNKTASSLASKGRVETAVIYVTDLESVKNAVRPTDDPGWGLKLNRESLNLIRPYIV